MEFLLVLRLGFWYGIIVLRYRYVIFVYKEGLVCCEVRDEEKINFFIKL